MPLDDLVAVARLSDRDLLEEVVRLAASEREATAGLVELLAEVDERRLYREEGYSSMFAYCTGGLRLSGDAAYHRISAARAVRSFPVILQQLRDGSLSVSIVALLRPHLTAANCERLLSATRGRTKRQVEVLIRSMAPLPDVRSSLRKLPSTRSGIITSPPLPASSVAAAPVKDVEPPVVREPAPREYASATPPSAPLASILVRTCEHQPTPEPLAPARLDVEPGGFSPLQVRVDAGRGVRETDSAPGGGVREDDSARGRDLLNGGPPPAASGTLEVWDAPRPAKVSVLSPGRYSLRVTLSAEGHDRLRRAQDLLRHTVPNGEPAVIVERALALLVEKLERTRFAARRRERGSEITSAMPQRAKRSKARERDRDQDAPTGKRQQPEGTAQMGLQEAGAGPHPGSGASTPGQRLKNPPGGDPTDRREDASLAVASKRTARAIPAAVKRAVWLRDQGRCTFVGVYGRCEETGGLEFHHRLPVADGGEATVENLCLQCKSHHRYQSERWFGTVECSRGQLAPGPVGASESG